MAVENVDAGATTALVLRSREIPAGQGLWIVTIAAGVNGTVTR